LIACLAIAGIPPFAGFFSKEEILLAAFQSNMFIYIIALITAGLTAFYMFRLYFSVFWNKPFQQHEQVHHHSSEGTATMKIPLIILAICSLGAGLIPFAHFITTDGVPLETHFNFVFSIAPVVLALAGILLAAFLYKRENDRPRKIISAFGGLYKASYEKFYIDEIYLFITRKIIFNLIAKPAAWIDRNIIDGFMNFLASFTARFSEVIRGFQSGRIQNYALYFFAGVLSMAALFIYLWK
jgi:NADH-quinone oxidoreductase subunit L